MRFNIQTYHINLTESNRESRKNKLTSQLLKYNHKDLTTSKFIPHVLDKRSKLVRQT